MIPEKTIVVGASGHLGRFLYRAYKKVHADTVGTDWKGRGDLPVLDLAAPSISQFSLGGKEVAWAAIAGCIRDFRTCETQVEFTRQRNVEGTLALTRQLTEIGIKIIYFSTDSVFNGTKGNYSESDQPHPLIEYSRQKYTVEKELLSLTKGQCLILRLGRIIGVEKGDGTLLDSLARSFVVGKVVDAARDQKFGTILVNDIPEIVMALQNSNARGIFHVTGPETVSRLSVAELVGKAMGASEKLVRAMSLDDIGDGLPRPKNTTLDCGRLKAAINFQFTPLADSVRRVVQNYQ